MQKIFILIKKLEIIILTLFIFLISIYNRRELDETEKRMRDISLDRIKNKNNNKIHYNYYYNSSNNNNQNGINKVEDNLLKNGFFVGKNKRNKSSDNYDNNSNSNYNNEIKDRGDIASDRINQILEKYKMMKEKEKKEKEEEINTNITNMTNNKNNKSNSRSKSNNKNKIIRKDKSYDYIIKIKGNAEDLYSNKKTRNNNTNIIHIPNINNINYNTNNTNNANYNTNNTNLNSNTNKIKDNDFDEEYEKLFHSKMNKRRSTNNLSNNKIDLSDYSNSVANILNSLDNQNNIINNNYFNNFGYDQLINSLNEPKIYRINKRKISRKSNKIENEQSKKSFLNSRIVDENKNKNYVLAPMKSIPITSISFRARMKYFSNKKEKNIEKLKKEKREEEKNIYTFQPKTSNNSLKVIKYNNNTESGNNTQKKKKVDYNRINNLYLDYKDKKSKIDILTKDYFKNAIYIKYFLYFIINYFRIIQFDKMEYFVHF